MKVQTCTEFDAAGVCTNTEWVDFGTAFFGLSDADLWPAVGAIAGLWMLAYLVKTAVRNMRYS
jgi:hypothetical protein